MRLSEMKKRRQGRCEAHVVRLVALAALVICAILIASPSVSWAQETGDETPETIVGEDRESVWQDPASVDNDEEGTPDDELSVQAEGDEIQGQELGVEDTFTRSWADIAKKFDQAATSAAPVSINIGNLVPAMLATPSWCSRVARWCSTSTALHWTRVSMAEHPAPVT